MTETEKNFNKWFDEYADGVQVFEETDMKMAYLQGCADEVEKWIKAKEQLEAQIEKMQETLKSDLIARLKENISYSTSPSCTKGMELFIKSIEKWEIKEK